VESAAQAFRGLAERYCDLIDRAADLDVEVLVRQVHDLLARLYASATALTEDAAGDVEWDHAEHVYDEWKARYELLGAKFGERNHYSEVFDPYAEDDGPVTGSLADDLADIYDDLRNGLALAETDGIDVAEECWTIHFEINWGEHALSAMRALYFWMRNLDIEDL
jgi:hypothetical protein